VYDELKNSNNENSDLSSIKHKHIVSLTGDYERIATIFKPELVQEIKSIRDRLVNIEENMEKTQIITSSFDKELKLIEVKINEYSVKIYSL
jgi:hypothetical protein